MTHTLNSIFLVGATGRFGSLVTMELAGNRDQFDRIAVHHDTSRPMDHRKQATLDAFRTSGIEIVPASGYDSPEIYKGFDCIISFLGNHALHRQPEIFEAAFEAGVRHFYPSEYGADLLVGQNWTQRYYRDKVITREFLESKRLQHPELEWTYITVGRLTEWAVLDHFGVSNKDATAQIYGTSDGRQSLLSECDAARYLAQSLKHPIPDVGESDGDTKGRHRMYRVSGQTCTWREIFEIVEKIRGVPYQVTYLDTTDALKEEADGFNEGDIEKELAASHKLIQGREGTLLQQPWDNHRFPSIQPVSVEHALRVAFSSAHYRRIYGLES